MLTFFRRNHFILYNLLVFTFLSFSRDLIAAALTTVLFLSPLLSFLTPIYNLIPYEFVEGFLLILMQSTFFYPIFLMGTVGVLVLYSVLKGKVIPTKNKFAYLISVIISIIAIFSALYGVRLGEQGLLGFYSANIAFVLGVLVGASTIYIILNFIKKDWHIEEAISPSVSKKRLLIGTILLLTFISFLPFLIRWSEIKRQQAKPLSRENPWIVTYRGKQWSDTLKLTVFQDKLYALRRHPNTLISFDGFDWKKVRDFNINEVTGMVVTEELLYVFGTEDGHNGNLHLYRFDGKDWQEFDTFEPKTGWNYRSTVWNRKVYLIAKDFNLYQLDSQQWRQIASLPTEELDSLRQKQISIGIGNINLGVYNDALLIAIDASLYTYNDDEWTKVISGKLPYETYDIRDFQNKLILAGYSSTLSGSPIVIFDGSSLVPIVPLNTKIYRGVHAIETFRDKFYFGASYDGVWVYDGKNFQKDTAYEKERYSLDFYEFGAVTTLTSYQDRLYAGGRENPYIYTHGF